MDDSPALYTIPQAAKRLSISESKAWEMSRSGQLPTLKLGRSVRVPKDALDRWIEQETRSDAA